MMNGLMQNWRHRASSAGTGEISGVGCTAVAKRSHLLAYREVPCQEVLKQPLIRAQSTAGEPWRAVAQRVLGDALQDREQLVSSFDIAMTLVSAGYGLVVAPSARLAGYLNRGIAARPLAGAPTVVMAYLLIPWRA